MVNEMTLPEMTADEIEKVRRPLEQAYTLPPQAYTSETVYEREIEQVMRRSWMPLARVEQVSKPGDYLTLDLFDQPLMIVHGDDGVIRAMSSVCLHRAAPIAKGGGNRKLFTCPYHAWSYDTEGRLVRAPHMEGVTEFSEKKCRLPQIRTEIWQGFVMVNLDPDASPFQPAISAFDTYFENFKLSEMQIVRTLEFDSNWNWKVLVENFMEAYHHIATHSQTLEPLFPAVKSVVPDNTGPWSILHMPAGTNEHMEGLPTIEGLEDWQANDLFAAVVFPCFLLAFQGGYATWYQVRPTGAGQLDLKIHILVPKSSMQVDNFEDHANMLADVFTVIHTEDIAANDEVWRGLKALMSGQGRLSLLEKSIWQLNQWWLDQMMTRP